MGQCQEKKGTERDMRGYSCLWEACTRSSHFYRRLYLAYGSMKIADFLLFEKSGDLTTFQRKLSSCLVIHMVPPLLLCSLQQTEN